MTIRTTISYWLILVCFVGHLAAQPWSTIISPSRAINWANGGVVGGIPSANWPICQTLGVAGQSPSYVQSVTGAQISAALAACPATYPSGSVVLLNPGTYNINYNGTTETDQAIILVSNTVLRGSGANQTLLVFNLGSYYYSWACNGGYANICLNGGGEYYGSSDVQPGQSNAATWTAGYAQGSNSITLTNVGSNGILNGQIIFLDQADDTVDTGQFFICDQDSLTVPCSLQAGSPGRTIGGVDYNQIQMVQVTAGCSNACTGAGPFTVTISPGLYSPNWRSSQTPGAWWASSYITNAGVENLSDDATNDTTAGVSNVQMSNAYNTWVSGCRLIRNSHRAQVRLVPCAHCTVQNNYLFGANATDQAYGVETFIAADSLIVNNIMQQVTSPHIIGPELGNVFAYNFGLNDLYQESPGVWTWMIPMGGAHDAGTEYFLTEGNIGAGWASDVFHGTGGFGTIFRNRFWGAGPNGNPAAATTQNTAAMEYLSYNRYSNTIGNVLGLEGYTNTYQVQATSASAAVYSLGQGNSPPNVPNDPLVASTMLRWGNYDTVTGATRWCGNSTYSGWTTICSTISEIPTLTSIATQVAATTTTMTYTGNNNYSAGQIISISGCNNTSFNQTNVHVASASSSSFTISGSFSTQAATSDNCTVTAPYGNQVPPSTTLPPSFYYSTTPTWWPSSKPWPPIGPDVTNGNLGICSGGPYANNGATSASQCGSGGTLVTSGGGHAYSNPAMDCYLNIMSGPPDGSGSVLSFNASSCYGQTAPVGNPSPTKLTVLTH